MISSVRFSPDGKKIINALIDSLIIWELESGNKILTIEEDSNYEN